jgi:hypothetical protein
MNILRFLLRFDPAFSSKVVRIAAAVCLLEFLSAITLLMMWVPASSKCLSWRTPQSIYMFILPAGGLAVWTCLLAILWTHIAKPISTQLQSKEDQCGFDLFSRAVPVSNVFIIGVIVSFSGFVAIPIVVIARHCGGP